MTGPGWVTGAAPWDQTGRVTPMADEDPSLIPGFAEGPHATGPSEPQARYWWGIGGAAVVALALLAVIAVLAASRVGHRGATNATPLATVALTPTGSISSSGAASSSASKSPTTSAASHQHGLAQASIIAGYLTESAQARQGIGAAISAISDCSNIAPAVATLHNAADVRAHIVTQLASADVSAVPNGSAAVADLGRAMRASADADRHYAAWGQEVARCHGHAPENAEFAAAQQFDTVSTAAKQRFADEWNPIAATYGLAKQTADTI